MEYSEDLTENRWHLLLDPFGCAQGIRTYRIEYTDNLRIPWQLLKDTIPQRFYRLVVVGQ